VCPKCKEKVLLSEHFDGVSEVVIMYVNKLLKKESNEVGSEYIESP